MHCAGDSVPAVERIEVTLRPRTLEIFAPDAAANDPRGPFMAEGSSAGASELSWVPLEQPAGFRGSS